MKWESQRATGPWNYSFQYLRRTREPLQIELNVYNLPQRPLIIEWEGAVWLVSYVTSSLKATGVRSCKSKTCYRSKKEKSWWVFTVCLRENLFYYPARGHLLLSSKSNTHCWPKDCNLIFMKSSWKTRIALFQRDKRTCPRPDRGAAGSNYQHSPRTVSQQRRVRTNVTSALHS